MTKVHYADNIQTFEYSSLNGRYTFLQSPLSTDRVSVCMCACAYKLEREK